MLLDFDGTVCVGDAPVWAYADAVVSTARASEPEAAALREALAAFLRGEPEAPPYPDGYAAVAALAAGFAAAADLDAAYERSRRALAAGSVEVEAPAGLVGLLAELGAIGTERVLITNAPAEGVIETLARTGLDAVIDRVVTGAQKPDGWSRLLPQFLAHRDPARVLAVGDIWRNDLEEPAAAGCVTALIDRSGRQSAPADLVAPAFEDLYPAISDWARGVADTANPDRATPNQRTGMP